MQLWLLTATFLHTLWSTSSLEKLVPCFEISRELRFPCNCALGPTEPGLDGDPAVSIDCDKVVFAGDFPSIPYGAPVVSFSQRWAGHQSLPTQVTFFNLHSPFLLFIIVINIELVLPTHNQIIRLRSLERQIYPYELSIFLEIL